MDDCTKVLVYGSFDGFARSTDSSLLISVVLDGGEKVEIPEEFIVSADQMVNKYKIKLKDVIKRIEMFDLGTKAVWINEILNELGSEYGAFKYKAGYEQGKFDGAMEHEKVTIPQFVADYIDFKKTYDFHVYGAMRVIEDHYDKRVQEWFYEGNIETFARAWLDGYTVEKEKAFTVKAKNVSIFSNYLNFSKGMNRWLFSDGNETESHRVKHTKKELQEGGFGEVFNSPLFEVKEVEE